MPDCIKKSISAGIGLFIPLFGFLLIVILTKLNVKGAVLISILSTTVVWYIATWQLPTFDMQNFGCS